MTAYAWPVFIRELRNFIEVGVSLGAKKELRKEDLPTIFWKNLRSPAP